MILARVVGTVVATRKDPRLVSSKLLVARPMDPHGKAEGSYLVAVDTIDAGVGETVLIVSGSSARMAAGMKDCPVDAAIVGIVDAVGPGADPARLGRRVGVPWLGHACGTCSYCRSDAENLCDAPQFTGYTRDGGFADCVLAESSFAFDLDPAADPVALAPLLCAGLIG